MNFLLILFLVVKPFSFDDPNRLPTKCETCKYLTNEISESLMKHNSPELIETGYNFDERSTKKKAKKYRDSEIRLIEVMEEVCEQILQYNVHAERSGSLRYSKGESQTMGTLKGLRDRGVKVELGIPYDLWDTPSAEITQLKKYCDQMVEQYEEEIEDWYKKERDNITLTEFLCEKRILKENEKSCLSEKFVENKEEKKDKEKVKKTKSDKNKRDEPKKEAKTDKSDL
ncbi:unnamed protein product [Brachionus calyciflorus]|uniref:DUF3456 domain-containing protein n=1 Tax=Brachionus calyciflorus TaxID=104777 RepID=A0A814MZC9_9BILA|nr:unnamed protein product [Brachionus calyciflorus]